jgi:malonyl-CoA decarboxylase
MESPVPPDFIGELASGDNLEANGELLRSLAAQYLLRAKRDDGLPLDPVARFHLSNGASVHDLHALADTSVNGLNNSFGAMVNYLYDMSKVESQHEAFAQSGEVIASKSVSQLAQAKLPAPLRRAMQKEDS